MSTTIDIEQTAAELLVEGVERLNETTRLEAAR
jgi:hypothetical protein